MPSKVESIEGQVVAKGHQQLGALSSAKVLTVPDGVLFALITPKGAGIWITADGTTPSVTNGQPIAVSQTLKYTADPKLLKIIEQTTSATVDIWYFGAN